MKWMTYYMLFYPSIPHESDLHIVSCPGSPQDYGGSYLGCVTGPCWMIQIVGTLPLWSLLLLMMLMFILSIKLGETLTIGTLSVTSPSVPDPPELSWYHYPQC